MITTLEWGRRVEQLERLAVQQERQVGGGNIQTPKLLIAGAEARCKTVKRVVSIGGLAERVNYLLLRCETPRRGLENQHAPSSVY